jgi:hypothetical protein
LVRIRVRGQVGAMPTTLLTLPGAVDDDAPCDPARRMPVATPRVFLYVACLYAV